MSTHRLCCCNPPTPGSCASLMCVESNPTTVVMQGITGVKRYRLEQKMLNPCTDDECNFVDFDSFYWNRPASLLEEVAFTMGATVLTRVGSNCCYIAEDAVVNLVWTRTQNGPYWMGCRCPGDEGEFVNGPLIDLGETMSGTVQAPACYRVECVTDEATGETYLMHKLSWCRVAAPALVTTLAVPEDLCQDPPILNAESQTALYIAPQQICWRSAVIPLVDIVSGDYVRQYWCGCDTDFDESCAWEDQTVYPCLTAGCSGNHSNFPYPFEYDPYLYDPENPPAPCLGCGSPEVLERCGGIVNMCYGGMYENNTNCYDCEHTLTVNVPLYA